LPFRQRTVLPTELQQSASRCVSLAKDVHGVVKVTWRERLRDQSDRWAAESEWLLQMGQEVTNQQILFDGDGKTDR
jgi:hypothetical protein